LTKAKLQEKYGDERVFAVPFTSCTKIEDQFTRLGFKATSPEMKLLSSIMAQGKFMLRADIEGDITFQQVIPYAFVVCNGNYFISRRIKGDSRLQGKLSLGFGGHLNPCDGDGKELYVILNGLKREMREETTIEDCEVSNNFYGFVRDLKSSTPDHIGVVFKYDVLRISANKLKIREKDTLEGFWMSEQELVRNIDKFESWAQYIIADIALRHNTKVA
jgi:predicted NUDIX family phosphoesterase